MDCFKPGTMYVTKPDAGSSLPHTLHSLLFMVPFPEWFRCKGLSKNDIFNLWGNAGNLLEIESCYVFKYWMHAKRVSVPFSWWQRLGHTIYPVTVAKKDTIDSNLKPDGEFTWISRQAACFLHAGSLWGNLLFYERCFTKGVLQAL